MTVIDSTFNSFVVSRASSKSVLSLSTLNDNILAPSRSARFFVPLFIESKSPIGRRDQQVQEGGEIPTDACLLLHSISSCSNESWHTATAILISRSFFSLCFE